MLQRSADAFVDLFGAAVDLAMSSQGAGDPAQPLVLAGPTPFSRPISLASVLADLSKMATFTAEHLTAEQSTCVARLLSIVVMDGPTMGGDASLVCHAAMVLERFLRAREAASATV